MRLLGNFFWRFFGLLLLTVSQVAAQENSPTNSALHCLWKAEGASNVVYLLGSIHYLRETDYPLPEIIESAFTKCQIAVFESDMSKPPDSNTAAILRARTSLPAGTTLKDLLPASVYVSFSNHVEEAGMSMAKSFDPVWPAIAVQKIQLIEFMRFGAYFDYGVDQHFAGIAQKSDKQIVELEPLNFQIDFFVNLSSSEQKLMVERFLARVDNEEKVFKDMVNAWKIGDSAALERTSNDLRTNAPTLFKKLVLDRNATWMPEIKQLLQGSQNAMVIVGVDHLIGPDGIIQLLKKQGVAVTQL